MDILDEFDIIIKELEKMVAWHTSAIAATLKYLILWCINASIA
jgi:hypothetical protein